MPLPPARDPQTGCLVWQGPKNSNGYGTTWQGGRPRQVHLAAWEDANGPLPKDKHLDHLCRNRPCMNLAHLELVSAKENMLRKNWAYRSKIKKCPQGHSTYYNGRRTPQGGQICKLCSGI